MIKWFKRTEIVHCELWDIYCRDKKCVSTTNLKKKEKKFIRIQNNVRQSVSSRGEGRGYEHPKKGVIRVLLHHRHWTSSNAHKKGDKYDEMNRKTTCGTKIVERTSNLSLIQKPKNNISHTSLRKHTSPEHNMGDWSKLLSILHVHIRRARGLSFINLLYTLTSWPTLNFAS